MKQFAHILNGRVIEVIPETISMEMPVLDGQGEPETNEKGEPTGATEQRDVPLAERYHPDFVAQLVPYDPANPPPEPEPEPEPVPGTVSMAQFRVALIESDQIGTVMNAIMNMQGTEGDKARARWEYSTVVERKSALVEIIQGVLGVTDEGLDQLFSNAAKA